ncbi:MAG: putative glycoside hydrolase [Spirochaetia bacterium]|nr:putative glycoside hydrolase [Spirochaetia bacterium]
MGRSILCAITAICLYGSMTCVHIPYSFRKASLLNVNSPYLISSYNEDSLENSFNKVPEPSLQKSLVSTQEKSSENIKLEKRNVNINVNQNFDNIKMDIYNIPIPEFVRGLYLSNHTAASPAALVRFIEKAKQANINTFVIDVQNEMIPREHVEMIKKAGIFPIARIVVFLGGLRTKTPAEGYIENLLDVMDAAAHQGFMEVQLDYIRYADSAEMEKLPLNFKYRIINQILKKTQEKANSLSIFLSADLFGRVTLNEDDHIGQKLENFSEYIDTIYPMLYPSHYTNDEYRIAHPYETVKEGVQKSLQRCKKTRIVAYIQGFSWKIETSGKNLSSYVKAQMEAVDDAGGDGWVIWNARNDYTDSFNALIEHDRKARKKISEFNKPGENSLNSTL